MPVNSSSGGGAPGISPLADRVIFIDGEALVVDKPAGLPVDPPRSGALSLENHLDSLTFGFRRWPTPVHRLDRDTSGCLILARNAKAHKRFTAAFEAQTVEKSYVAVLAGVPDAAEGRIDLALGKTSSKADGWRMVADPRGKAASTGWRVIARRDGRALVLFTPRTGRTHQIRAHALYGLGHGIVGDPVYGETAAIAGDIPMLLHARSIRLPRDGKPPVEATAPIPERFASGGFGDAEALLSGADGDGA